MTRNMVILALALLTSYGTVFAQQIPPSQVPSLVLNHFSKTFPNARDSEWKIKNNEYVIEFETGWSRDHEAWYDKSGKLLKHKEEISARDIPNAVRATVKSRFSGYRIDDVKKATSGSSVQYNIELKSTKQEWKVTFDEKGTVLEQHAD